MIGPTAQDTREDRLAAIDVGTNTIRLVVVEVRRDRTFRVIDDERVRTRLGHSLADTGRLDDRAMDLSVRTIANFRRIADGYGVARLRAVATSAVRDAGNGGEFVKLISEETGVTLEVITAEDEARLAFLAVSSAFELGAMPIAVVDVGGGSTEVVLSSGAVIERICPLRLGAVRLTEQFNAQRPITGEDYKALRRFVREHVRKTIGKAPFTPHMIIGTGGTFTNLAAMSMHRGVSTDAQEALPPSVRGYEMQRFEVKHFLNLLRKMPSEARQNVPGLKPDRADIIVAGLTIVDCVLKHLGVNRVRIHDQGIRAGIIREMVGAAPKPSMCNATKDRVLAAQQFAETCQHEQGHARHVATLAMQLFDDLVSVIDDADGTWTTPASRELLHVASVLHDVGYLISYERHHKHSYHIIMHSNLVGFTRRELEIVANIARYHRGAKPRTKHSNFARLSPEDQRLVKQLASILRLAVGLDRSHRQLVARATLKLEDGMAVITLHAEDDPAVEMWGAERKCGLFTEVFQLPVRLTWTVPADPQEVATR